MDAYGVSLCLRFAFPPNSLHYCGPEKQADILGYLQTHTNDKGLHGILSQFETLYPYLQLIAGANHIKDPFDRRVVEAYWLGNRLLERVPKRDFHMHLTESIKIQKKLPKKGNPIMDGIMSFGMPHHTFHVLIIYLRTGKNAITHTIHTMDSCRIGWGKVLSADVKKGIYMISMQHVVFEKNTLTLSHSMPTQVKSVDGVYTPGDMVSVHWGYICGKLLKRQIINLEHFTQKAMTLANSLHSSEHLSV
jgi:hypothetical protein